MLLLVVSVNSVANQEPNSVRHYQYQSRYVFGHDVLELALSYSDKPYQIIDPDKQSVNEARGEHLVTTGELDVQWLSTSTEREQKMIPIRIPVYRGILGLRLLLATKEQAPELSKIRTLGALRKYSGGHGSHWQDLPVYAANNLPVKTYGSYEALFKQLEKNRFDYFHRGVNEIWEEHDRYQNTLSVVDNLMLFYDHPVYFFVSKSRPQLALDIEKGLNAALKDGSFKKIFLEFHRDMLDKSNLAKRKLIYLKNPVAPKKHPTTHWEWWLNSKSTSNQ